MSSIKHPAEKKRLSYSRDHYNRNGESNKAWRKTKPLKKAKARRAFRKESKALVRVCADEESAPVTSLRKLGGARARKIPDWGSVRLREFVPGRQRKRAEMVGARKRRRARRDAAG